MTFAETHKTEIAKKYNTNLETFKTTVGDNTKEGYCKFRIKFLDFSTIDVVMTSAQRNGIVRSKLFKSKAIKSIEGMGFVKPVDYPPYVKPIRL